MKQIFRIVALGFVLAGSGFWLATGANRGWTKNNVPTKTMDQVTGIEGVTYEKKFVPGVDFLGAVLTGAGILLAASSRFKNKKTAN